MSKLFASRSTAAEPRALPRPLPSLILFEHAHLKHMSITRLDQQLRSHGYIHLVDLKHQDPRGARMKAANRLYALESRRRGPAAGGR